MPSSRERGNLYTNQLSTSITMTTTRVIQCSSEFAGSIEGTFHDDRPDDATTSTTRLSSLTIGHGPGIHSIEVCDALNHFVASLNDYHQVTWSNGASKNRGTGGFNTTKFILLENERVTTVQVYYPEIYGAPFRALSLETNYGMSRLLLNSRDPRELTPIRA